MLERLSTRGFLTRRTEKSATLRGLVHLLGAHLDALKSEPVVRVMMDAQIRKGRAYTLTCPFCALAAWYYPAQLSEQLACQGCGADLQPPLNADFAYLPNPLLTLRYFHGLPWEAGIMLDGIEIDLILEDANGLLLVECKDRLRESDRPQLEKILVLAGKIAARVYLATLSENPPPYMLNELKMINRMDLLA